MRKFVLALLSSITLLMGFAASPGAQATTTTLTFDDVPTGPLTTQYQSLGVLVSGVTVVNSSFSAWPAYSAPNFALAPNGLMTFTLAPTIIGNVQSVSAYISASSSGIGIFAYDASSNLVGQTLLPTGSPNNTLVSVTSSGNPIVTVTIHDGGSTFVIDNLAFATDVPFAKYAATVYLAPKLSSFSATETFTLGANNTGLNPPTQAVTLALGTLTLSIPAGSFAQDMPPRTSSYAFEGSVNGGTLYVSISPTKTPNTYKLFALGVGYAIPSGLSTMPVSLSVADNDGHTNVAPNYVPRVPTSP